MKISPHMVSGGEEKLPKEVSRGILKIADFEVEVIVLDNGQRLFTEEGFKKITDFMFNHEKI